jgi:hypothetical protein
MIVDNANVRMMIDLPAPLSVKSLERSNTPRGDPSLVQSLQVVLEPRWLVL